MPNSSGVVNGALVAVGNPDFACFTDFASLWKAIPQFFAVSIPSNITNVIVSNVQPTSSQTSYIWFRMSNGGQFIGVYLYSGGTWKQIFPAPGQITWTTYGTAATPPPGYITTDDSTLNSALKAYLKSLWRSNGSGSYDYYSIILAPV